MPERPLDAIDSQQPAQATGQQQILQAIPAIRTQFDYNMISLLGIQQSFDLFVGMRGISDARQQQFDSFSRGEMQAISGTGLSETNLLALESRREEALRYGIEITVDLANRRFEITNTNYAPISVMTPEEHAMLVSAVLKGQEYLNTAETLRSEGRNAEAEMYVARALQVQAVFSTCVEAFLGMEATQAELGRMENAPRAGGSERAAQELVRAITGRGVSDAELPAEFERITGVAYSDFLVREENGELVGRGISAVAERDYREAVEGARQAVAELGESLRMVYDGTSLGMVEGEGGAQQLAASGEFMAKLDGAVRALANAGALAEVGKGIMENVYGLMVAREGAAELDSINFEQIFTVRREVRPDVPPDQVAMAEYESYLMPGYYRHSTSLEGERDGVRRSYSSAESDFRDAALYLMAQPETQAGAEQYARLSEEARAGGERALSDAAEGSGHLQRRVSSILAYEPIWQEINSFAYRTPLELADPSGALVAERDGISARLDQAMQDGATVENVGTDLRNLEYRRMAGSLEQFQFPEVTGAKARAGLDELRGQLVGALRGAADSGIEISNLAESDAALMGAYEECINFERTVENAAGQLYAQAESLRSGIKDANQRTGAVLRDIPDDVTYEEAAHGDTAAREYRVDLRDNKALIEERLGVLEGYSQELATQESRIVEWRDSTIDSYEPALVVQSRGTYDVGERYGLGNSRYFSTIREIDAEMRDTGRMVGASFTILGELNRDMVGEYSTGLQEAQQAAQAASGIDFADPFGWALGGAIFRTGQLGWRGAQFLWTKVTAKAAQEGALAFTARSTELAVRAIPTLGTITQNTYAGYEMATANNFDEFMEGASWMGALGTTGGLVGVVGKGAKFLSVAVDALAVGTMVAGIGYQTYRAFESGGGEWWDLARVGGMGALGIFGSGMGLAGSFGMRVPGGFRDILPSGLLGGRVVGPGAVMQAVEGGGRILGEDATIAMRQLTPIEREGLQASAAARRELEDSTAIRKLASEFEAFERNPARMAEGIPNAEVAALVRIRYEHPDWNATQVAVRYVEDIRMQGAAIPPRLLAGIEAQAQIGRAATELAPAARAPARLPPTTLERAPEVGAAARAPVRVSPTVLERAPVVGAATAAAEGEALGRAMGGAAQGRVAIDVQVVRAAEFRQAVGREEPVAALGNYLYINGVRGRVNFPPPPAGQLAEGEVAFRDTFSAFIRENPRVFEIKDASPMRIGETELRFGGVFECEGRAFVPVYVTRNGETNIEFFYRSTSQTSWRLATRTEGAGAIISKGMSEQLLNAPAAMQHRLTQIAQQAGEEVPHVDSLTSFLPDTRLNPAEASAAGQRLFAAQEAVVINGRRLDTSNPQNWPDFPETITRGQMEHILAGEIPPGMGGVEAVTRGRDEAHGDYVLATVLSKNKEYRYNVAIYSNGDLQVASIEATRGVDVGAAGLPTAGVEVSSGMTREQAATLLRQRHPGVEPGDREIRDFISRADKAYSEIVYAPRLQYGDQVQVLRDYRDAFGVSVSTSPGYGGYSRVVLGAAEGMEMNPFLRNMEESGGRFAEAMESALPAEARISIAAERSRMAGSTYTQEQYARVMGAMEEGRYYTLGEIGIQDEAQNAMQIYEGMILERARAGQLGGMEMYVRRGTRSDELMVVVGYEDRITVIRIDLSDVRRQSILGGEAAGNAAIELRMDTIRDALSGDLAAMRGGYTAEQIEQVIAVRLESAMADSLGKYAQYPIEGQGRTLAEFAGDLRHPDSLAKFKFDMVTLEVSGNMQPGFLNRALVEASASGSAAHGRVLMDAVGLPPSPVFRSSSSIRTAAPGEVFDGTAGQLSVRFRDADAQRATEEAYTRYFDELGETGMRRTRFTPAEENAMLNTQLQTGYIPMDEMGRYGFRKGVGQLTPTEGMHAAVGAAGPQMQIRARAGNSLWTEEGWNTVASVIDSTVASYAEREGLTIVRANEDVAPGLGYIILGVHGDEGVAHFRQINVEVDAALERYRLASSGYTTADVAGAGLAQVDAALTSGAVGVALNPQMMQDCDYVISMLTGGSSARLSDLAGIGWEGNLSQLAMVMRERRVRTLSDLAAVDREAFESLVDLVNTVGVSERLSGIRAATQGAL